MKFYTEHGSDTAMLCAKLQNDSTTEMDVIVQQDFVMFKFIMSVSILYILYCYWPYELQIKERAS